MKTKIKISSYSISNLISGVFCLILFFTLIAVSGCEQQGRGFALPPGDIEAGKQTFSTLSCDQCHSVGSIEWKGQEGDVHIKLGGSVSQIKSYGDLVTSIINPSHKIAKEVEAIATNRFGVSKMRNYNDVMTVQELVDLVTFLQSEYELEIPREYYMPY